MHRERMKEEYNELSKKHLKLGKLLIAEQSGKLGFTLSCPISLLEAQYKVMGDYLDILEERAIYEEISL